MLLSRPTAWFLLLVGAWTWLIWPRFLVAIWRDERAFEDGPTSFLLVHVVLVAASLAIGTGVGWVGWRGLRAWRGQGEPPRRRGQPASR